MNRSKAKTSYTKLTSRQRMEILDYWSKNHYPYSVICNYFSEKWHQEVKKTTVGDLILQWKRKNYIRGVNKVDSIDRALHACVKEIVQILEDQRLQMSDDVFYAMCYGELLNRGLNAFSLTLDQIKQIVPLYYHPDVPSYLQDNLSLEDVSKVQQSYSPSNTFYLDAFQFYYHCIPYRSYCYLSDTKYLSYRDRMEVLVVFSADGKSKFSPFISGDRFSTSIDRVFSVVPHKHGMYNLVGYLLCLVTRERR